MSSHVDRITPAKVAHLVDEKVVRLTDKYPIPRFDGSAMSRQSVSEEPLLADCSISQVEEILDATFSQEQPPTSHMERLVCALGSATQLGQIISDVIQDDRRLASVTAISEKHPLGFYKIPLLSKPMYQLRLNIRPSRPVAQRRFARQTVFVKALEARQDVHNHEFDAASRVLAGSLLTRIYEFVDEAPLRLHTMQQIKTSDDPVESQRSSEWLERQSWRIAHGYVEEHEPRPVEVFRANKSNRDLEAMEFVGAGNVRPIYNAIIEAGGVYSFTHSTFHRDWPLSSSSPTATLFLRGRPDFGPDIIARLLPFEERKKMQKPKEQMTSREIRLGLLSLKRLMAK